VEKRNQNSDMCIGDFDTSENGSAIK